MIRLTFRCEGPRGIGRASSCREEFVFEPSPNTHHGRFLPLAMEFLLAKGWRLIPRSSGDRYVVRCPKCEVLRLKEYEAKVARDRMRAEKLRGDEVTG